MYNLYTYEKKLFENFKKKSEEEHKNKLKQKRKKELHNLSQNYDNRMKKFLFTMCERPFILRKKLNPDTLNKTLNNKKFIFGEYKTEKQRLQEMESIKDKLKEYDQKRRNIEKKRNLLKIMNNRDFVLIQPEMKFTSKTKLEKIIDSIKKDDMFKLDLLDNSLLEKIQNNKFSKARKIKEFYNLIDKDFLNDKDIKKTIRYMNEIEQDQNNKYTFKDYMDWKYYGIITYNNLSKRIDNEKNRTNKNDFLQNMGKEDSKNEIKNKYELLVKDDFKTHFKGLSQFVEFLELKSDKEKNNKFETARNSYESDKNSSSINRAIMFALKQVNKSTSLRKEILAQEKLKAKTARNIRKIKKFKKKSPSSVENIYSSQEKKIINKNNYSIKDLNDISKRKKLRMISLMDKELNNSISKKYMQKYNSMNFFGEIINIPKNYEFEANDKFSEIKKDKNINAKRKLLLDHIIEQMKIVNDIKYKRFIKKFSKSIFGFKKKYNAMKNVDELKADNKVDYIVFEGKPYLKKDIKTLSDIVFKKCNYYNTKKLSEE